MRPTVLLVDDHEGFRARARVMLEAQGFDVIAEAADGLPRSTRRLAPPSTSRWWTSGCPTRTVSASRIACADR